MSSARRFNFLPKISFCWGDSFQKGIQYFLGCARCMLDFLLGVIFLLTVVEILFQHLASSLGLTHGGHFLLTWAFLSQAFICGMCQDPLLLFWHHLWLILWILIPWFSICVLLTLLEFLYLLWSNWWCLCYWYRLQHWLWSLSFKVQVFFYIW